MTGFISGAPCPSRGADLAYRENPVTAISGLAWCGRPAGGISTVLGGQEPGDRNAAALTPVSCEARFGSVGSHRPGFGRHTKALPFLEVLQLIGRWLVQACRRTRSQVPANPPRMPGPGLSAAGRICPPAGMTRPQPGRQKIQSHLNVSVSARRPVPSVTAAPRRAGQSNMLNEVGESNFAAIVDRHNRLVGSGDHR